jgi:hypothetical protein
LPMISLGRSPTTHDVCIREDELTGLLSDDGLVRRKCGGREVDGK